jgi:chitin synthase
VHTLAESYQDIEHRLINFVEKPIEDTIGYVSVLPSAFSVYRWKILSDKEILDSYFQIIRETEPDNLTCTQLNTMIAEDRVLPRAIYFQKESANQIRYLKTAIAFTKVPDNIFDIIE